MQNPELKNNFILYTDSNGDVKLEVFVQDETVWLTQKMLSVLFDVDVRTVSEHIQNILKSEELQEVSVIRKFRTTAEDGKNYEVQYYNLDMIISVGYRVNSSRATQFRIWATQTLREYIVKGFVLNDNRLKQGEKVFDKDYFKELLEKVRSIRASERRIWLQITDIFSECSTDYVRGSEQAQEFFATVQNKFHYAITGHTAAEIISLHADSNKDHMGLTTWKNSPSGRILKSDVTIAKNYLQESDIKKLERTVSSFFDYIENQIENKNAFNMSEFVESVNKFLSFNDFKILDSKRSISKEMADAKAEFEYDIYNKNQKIESDFEKEMKKVLNKKI
jgi:hypothetical protein